MKQKKGWLARTAGIVIVLVLIILAATGILESYLNRRNSFAAEDPFAFDAHSDNLYLRVGDGLLVASDVRLALFDGEGREKCSLSRNFPEVLCAVSGEFGLAYSQSGNTACVLGPEGMYRDLSLPGSILSADVSAEGSSVFVTEEQGFKGAVTVFEPQGEAVYRVYLGDGYPMDADVSQDGKHVSVLAMNGSGSRVSVYAMDKEEVAYQWDGEDVLYFELEYLKDGNLLLLSTEDAVFLSGKGGHLSSFSFEGEYLKDFAAGDGFVTLVLGKYRTGSAARVVNLDESGNILGTLDVTAEVEGLSASQQRLCVRFSDRTVVYDKNLKLLGSLDSTAGSLASLMRSDGNALIVSGGGAAIFEP